MNHQHLYWCQKLSFYQTAETTALKHGKSNSDAHNHIKIEREDIKTEPLIILTVHLEKSKTEIGCLLETEMLTKSEHQAKLRQEQTLLLQGFPVLLTPQN